MRAGGDGEDQALVKTILMAIKTGFYHFDGAEGTFNPLSPNTIYPVSDPPKGYGDETELGTAIKESGVPREKFFITTKISGSKATDTEANFTESLRKLQTDYVDLYLIHAPFFAQ